MAYRSIIRQPWSEYLKNLRWIPPEVLAEVRPRLPQHYLTRLEQYEKSETPDLHLQKDPNKYTIKYGFKIPTTGINTPIPTFKPLEADDALWGGEAYIKGFSKFKYAAMRVPRIWRPLVKRRILYSEILDRHMNIQVTLRTMELIDENQGLDFYILRSSLRELDSKLGSRLKREMTLALSIPSLHPDNVKKRNELLKKYAEFKMPVAEAEWLGLTLKEAVVKQLQVEEARVLNVPKEILHLQTFMKDTLARRRSQAD